jgi:hypothetical protein
MSRNEARDDGFLARWSRRKLSARDESAPAEPAALAPESVVAPVEPVVAPAEPVAPPAQTVAAPPPTLEDVAALTRDADFSRFVAPGVDDGVKRAALRKLFSDPHFNVMDGLDTYIDDYNKADPLPVSMLRKMAQAAALGLLEDDENAGLQLQPDDAHRRPGLEPGAAGESGREEDPA